jgi:hypothetical protein
MAAAGRLLDQEVYARHGCLRGSLAATERERIPASEMIHFYDPERADQTRGISWLVQSMIRMRHLGATKKLRWSTPGRRLQDGFLQAGDRWGGVHRGRRNGYRQPRHIGGTGSTRSCLRVGVYPYEPKYPDQQYDGFVRATLRECPLA